jgi:hypothetical protein
MNELEPLPRPRGALLRRIGYAGCALAGGVGLVQEVRGSLSPTDFLLVYGASVCGAALLTLNQHRAERRITQQAMQVEVGQQGSDIVQ